MGKRCWAIARSASVVVAAVATYFATFSDTITPYEGAGEALKQLHDMGLRVGILSHVPWPGWACREWYVRHGWADYVDFYSLSSDVGFIKPHPAHYEDTLKQAGCPVAQIAHVGDHPHCDVEGPKAFGANHPQSNPRLLPRGRHRQLPATCRRCLRS